MGDKNRKSRLALGLMSGTSMDGIDAALLETDGKIQIKRGQRGFYPYPEETKKTIRQAIEAAAAHENDSREQIISLPEVKAAADIVTRAHIEAVRQFMDDHHIAAGAIDLIGFHGQTILHRPEKRLTIQLGNGRQLGDETGIAVVGNFREADIQAGGQGAPLVPVYHRALVRQAGLELPVAVLNIGGVANVSWIGGDGDDDLIAFDCGPGNALIDDWVRRHGAGEMDEGGRLAAKGRLYEKALSRLLADPFFSQEPPKSLDRNHFSLAPLEGLSLEWGARTLTAFTALAAAKADFFFPMPPRQWIICGGGARNPVLMAELKLRLEGEVIRADELGWPSDHMEAEAFAFLAVRSLLGLPLTFPTTTGVPQPLSGGEFYPAHQ